MRISLIHGQDLVKAYSKYQDTIDKAKQKGFEIINIDSPKNVVSQSLFEDKIVFTLEKPTKVSLLDWKWLKANSLKYNSNLLIYYEGDAPKTVTKFLPKDLKVEQLDLPKIIFEFLDSLPSGNYKQSIKLLDELLKNEPIELVFHLLSARLRELYWTKVSPQTLNLPAWRKQKLNTKFPKEKLESMINKLAEIDIRSKRGENLRQMLDIFIIEALK